MIVNGQDIAAAVLADVRERIARLARTPQLAIVTCAPTFATQKFLEIKRERAEAAGVELIVRELPEASTTDECVAAVQTASALADGVIVQLPFPPQIAIDEVLAVVPEEKDVDGVGAAATRSLASGEHLVLPPVVGAMAEIADRHGVSFAGARTVVIGAGRLVGAPAAQWLRAQGADVTILEKGNTDLAAATRAADVLVLGAGVPGLVTPEMIKDGAVLFDAGTSEEGGKLAGDADPACAERAALFTPVPGGIGPITVSMIFKNLIGLIERAE